MLAFVLSHLSLLHRIVTSSMTWFASAAWCWVAAKLRWNLGMSKPLVVSSKVKVSCSQFTVLYLMCSATKRIAIQHPKGGRTLFQRHWSFTTLQK